MILCNKICYPCCDFCIHAQHETIEVKDNNGIIRYLHGGPIGCTRYNDEEHDNLAFNCSFCDEFWCASSRWPDSWVLMNINYWRENNINDA